MEVVINFFGERATYARNGRQILDTGLAHLAGRAEAMQQRPLAPGPTPAISSSGEALIALARRARWLPMAKRCASSRRRCRK